MMQIDGYPNFYGCGEKPAVVYGWVCPKCGRVMSPNMQFCPCSGEGTKMFTSADGTGTMGKVKE